MISRMAGACLALAMMIVSGAASGESKTSAELKMAEAAAAGQCAEGDAACRQKQLAAPAQEDGGSKSDDRSSEDDDSDSKDGKSDDKGSEDDDSDSKDGKSDDKSSEDDDSDSKDGKSDDKSSEDDDSRSDDDSSSDDGAPVLPEVSISSGEGREFNDITQVPVDLSISLSMVSGEPVTVAWTTEDGTAEAGTDYVFSSGQVTIPAGALVTGITVFIIGDDINELTETFFVRLSMPVGANIGVNPGEVLIIDDDDLDD